MSTPWTLDGIPEVVCLIGPVQSYRNAIHDDFKLFVVDGTRYTVTRDGRSHRAESGELLVLHPGRASSGVPEAESGRWRIICVPEDAVAEVTDPAEFRFDPPILHDGRLVDRFGAVLALFERRAPALECESGLFDLLAAVASAVVPGGPVDPVTDRHAVIATTARTYLRDRLDRNVSLGELAEAAGTGRFATVRACTTHFGLPPHALHLRLRLDRACGLIREGTPLATVAVQTGFHDQAHFTRRFSQAYGETPTQYRDAWLGTGDRRKLTFQPTGDGASG